MRRVTAGAELALAAVGARSVPARILALAGMISLAVAGLVAVVTATQAVPATELSALVGMLGTLLVVWAVARAVAVLPRATGTGPIVAAREHHRALARRPVPRHRDPDAPGHTRSRAPSEPVPAA
jgi:Family of unknown function (DUF6412)